MKIKLDQYDCCTSKDCPFKSECAQHETAGDFRTEDGFSPEIHKVCQDYVCGTADQEIDDDVRHRCVPVNVNSLGRGYRTLRNIPAKTEQPSQIGQLRKLVMTTLIRLNCPTGQYNEILRQFDSLETK